VTVLPGPPAAPGHLVLGVDEAGVLYEVAGDQRDGDVVHCVRDWDAVVERMAQSAEVVIEHGREPGPVLLGARPPGCADDPWLTRVAGCLMSVLPDLPSCCQLVSAVLSRLAGVPVTVARRPAPRARPRGHGGWPGGHRFQLGGRWVRELPVDAVAGYPGLHTAWSLVIPEDLPDREAMSLAAHPLVVRLAGLLGPGQPARLRQPIPQPLPSLIRAVVAADAGAFAGAAAALAHAVVTIVGSDGTVIASSAAAQTPRPGSAWEPPGEAREILLCDEAGLHGAIRVGPGSAPEVVADLGPLLGDLGLALIRSIESGRHQRTLENQLVMLTCLSGRGTEGAFWPDCVMDPRTVRRLVIVRAADRIDGRAGARLLDAVVRAAEQTDVLSGLCMVTSQGSLVGLYPDTGQQLARHRRSWDQVLRSVVAYGRLTAAVGATVSDVADFPGQNHLLGEIAKIQQSGSRYFNLPPVALLDELGPLAEVIGATPGRGFAPFVERVLGDLLDDTRFGGQLIETLYAYLQTGGSPREAGALLHLHPSTVKYRVRVIRELLGPRLADQGGRLDIELAVRLCLAAGLPRTGPAR
jgi:hypothetical protein